MVRVGLVGAGFMGKMHANVYSVLDDATLVAVADTAPGVAAEVAGQWDARAYESFEDMMAAEKLDLVDICLPTYLHAEYTVKAANAGVDVMCEKPMAMTVEEADRMIAAARDNNVRLMIGHCIRFWPEYEILKEYTDSGRLGRLKSINLTRVSPLPVWCWDGWLLDESRSGSAVLDLHIHDTDYILYLLGQPDEIFSRGTQDKNGLSHIYTTMTFGNTVASIEGGWDFNDTFPFKMAFRAVFEKGALAMDGGPLTIYEDGKDPVQPEIDRMEAAGAGGNISDLGGYYREIKYLIDCIVNNKPLVTVTPQSSRQSLAVVMEEIRQAKAGA